MSGIFSSAPLKDRLSRCLAAISPQNKSCNCPVSKILAAWDAREAALVALAQRGAHHDTTPTTSLPANDVGAVHSFYVEWCKKMDKWVRAFARNALEDTTP